MANTYPFIYQATISWYEISEHKSHHYRIAGLGFCDSYTDAIQQIEKREGDTLESIEHLEIIGEKNETIIPAHEGLKVSSPCPKWTTLD